MAKQDREILEMIAADMVIGSMEYIGEFTIYDALDEVKTLTDSELLEFITNA